MLLGRPQQSVIHLCRRITDYAPSKGELNLTPENTKQTIEVEIEFTDSWEENVSFIVALEAVDNPQLCFLNPICEVHIVDICTAGFMGVARRALVFLFLSLIIMLYLK